jgi:hypothetical protein
MTKSTKNDFNLALLALCDEIQQHGFRCAYRVRILANNLGGIVAVKHLLNARKPSPGFTDLCLAGCLHITVEALAIRHQHHFSQSEIKTAMRRLQGHREQNFACA